MNYSNRIISLIGLASLGALCSAQVNFADIGASAVYSQTSNAQPSSPDGYFYFLRSIQNLASDAATGTVVTPNSAVLPLTLGGNTLLYQSGYYASFADMQADLPYGTYNYEISGGTLGTVDGTVNFGAGIFPDQNPWFTGTTFSDAQAATTGSPVNFTWNTYTPDSAATFNLTYFTIYDTTANTTVYNNFGDEASYTSDSIAGSLLTAGDSYIAQVVFSTRYDNQGTGFSGSTDELYQYNAYDSFNFQAVPEPTSLLILLGGAVSLIRRKKLG